MQVFAKETTITYELFSSAYATETMKHSLHAFLSSGFANERPKIYFPSFLSVSYKTGCKSIRRFFLDHPAAYAICNCAAQKLLHISEKFTERKAEQ